MRPVNRSLPANQTYPPDYAGLSLQQQQIVEFWYAMFFETKTAQCDVWAQQLEVDYDIDYQKLRGSIATGVKSGQWTTLTELNNESNAVQLD